MQAGQSTIQVPQNSMLLDHGSRKGRDKGAVWGSGGAAASHGLGKVGVSLQLSIHKVGVQLAALQTCNYWSEMERGQ